MRLPGLVRIVPSPMRVLLTTHLSRIFFVVAQSPSLVQKSTLDVEERRIILTVPGRPTLDIDVSLSDGEIVAWTNIAFSSVLSSAPSPVEKEALDNQKQEDMKQALQLKRQRDFDVNAADAEWKVGTGEVSIFV